MAIKVVPVYPFFAYLFQFGTSIGKEIDTISGRKLVICCDGSNGHAARTLGLSDDCIHHSSFVYGACAAIERPKQTLVPNPETRVHNLTFDLSAYGGATTLDEDGQAQFSLKIFGNSKCRYMALAVDKCESTVIRTLRTILDKSVSIYDLNARPFSLFMVLL